MEEAFEAHAAWRALGDAGLISARQSLERYVMTKIAALGFEAVRDDEQETFLRTLAPVPGTTPGWLEEAVLNA